jgi:hypothetical protein
MRLHQLLALTCLMSACASPGTARRADEAKRREAEYQRMRVETDAVLAARAEASSGLEDPQEEDRRPAPRAAARPAAPQAATRISPELAAAMSSNARLQGLSSASIVGGLLSGTLGGILLVDEQIKPGIAMMGLAVVQLSLASAFAWAGNSYLDDFTQPAPTRR